MAPEPVDIVVGLRLRFRRKELGWSQEQLAGKIGVSFQQLQKYEKGTNRVGASRLHAVACALDVPVGYFFEDAGEDPNETDSTPALHIMRDPGGIELVTAYSRIADPALRKIVLDLARKLGGLSPAAKEEVQDPKSVPSQ